MKYSLILLFALLSSPGFAGSKCELPITSSIMKLRPNISCDEAYDMAKSIYLYAKKYRLDWKNLTAIAFKESTLCKYKKGKNENGHIIDYGCYQINVTNIWRMKLNPDRLLSDFDYNLDVACKILRHLKLTYKIRHPNSWLGFYKTGSNVSNPEIIKEATEYFDHIKEIKKKIDGQEIKKESCRP